MSTPADASPAQNHQNTTPYTNYILIQTLVDQSTDTRNKVNVLLGAAAVYGLYQAYTSITSRRKNK